jgi:hypothetical protein
MREWRPTPTRQNLQPEANPFECPKLGLNLHHRKVSHFKPHSTQQVQYRKETLNPLQRARLRHASVIARVGGSSTCASFL